MSESDLLIKKSTDQDFDGIWEIFHSVIASGDTYAYLPNTNKEEAYHFWMPPHKETFVAVFNNKIVGTYYIKENQPGLGSHVANAAYMVHPAWHGKGIGSAMARHLIEQAKRIGFTAIQFNLVVSTNESAIRLWKKFGFNIIGTTPNGFKHAKLGFVDTFIMYKKLD